MLSQFIIAHAFEFLLAGVLISLISGIWILFAAYQSDISLARITYFLFPVLIYKIVLEHPEKCLLPFIINMIGFVFFLCGIFGFWTKVSGLH